MHQELMKGIKAVIALAEQSKPITGRIPLAGAVVALDWV
jgi:hypothetical protein